MSRATRRDGFSHYQGAGSHTAESEAHQQGKAALLAWVQATYGHLGVVAVAERSTSDGKRIADVMVTWPDGALVALEVQYAPLSVEQWRLRHESYREQGITDVWLLGHTSKHLRQARRQSWEAQDAADGLVTLGDLHHAMTQAGVPVLWINPAPADGAAAGIGTAAQTATPHTRWSRPYGDGHDDEVFQVPAVPPTVRGVFLADPLDACSLTPAGMSTPTLDRLYRSAAELAAIDEDRRAEDIRRAASERAADEARAERARASSERRTRWVQERRAEQQAAWETSHLKERVLARHDGQIPALFMVRLGNEGGIYAPPEHWRCAIYRHLIWNKTGKAFAVPAVYAAIHEEVAGFDRSPKGLRSSAVITWLAHLERHGYLDIDRAPQNYETVIRVLVRGDLEHPPPPRPVAPPPPAPVPDAPAPTAMTPQHDGAARAADIVRERIAARAARPAPPRPAAPRPPSCRACGRELNPVLADIGRHVLC